MSALLHDPCCALGLASVAVYVIGWASVSSVRKLRRWWAAREARRSMAQLPE